MVCVNVVIKQYYIIDLKAKRVEENALHAAIILFNQGRSEFREGRGAPNNYPSLSTLKKEGYL